MPTRSVHPPPTTPHPTTTVPRQARRRRLAARAAWATTSALLLVGVWASPALAQTPQEADLGGVIDRLRLVILGLASALAALFVTIAGVRLLFGGDDPGQVEKGKKGLRNAALGYGIAVLALTLVSLLDYIVGS